ncbi:hypothetical protein V8C35DRAFT_281025 [Trichoderma chlorosporum]
MAIRSTDNVPPEADRSEANTPDSPPLDMERFFSDLDREAALCTRHRLELEHVANSQEEPGQAFARDDEDSSREDTPSHDEPDDFDTPDEDAFRLMEQLNLNDEYEQYDGFRHDNYHESSESDQTAERRRSHQTDGQLRPDPTAEQLRSDQTDQQLSLSPRTEELVNFLHQNASFIALYPDPEERRGKSLSKATPKVSILSNKSKESLTNSAPPKPLEHQPVTMANEKLEKKGRKRAADELKAPGQRHQEPAVLGTGETDQQLDEHAAEKRRCIDRTNQTAHMDRLVDEDKTRLMNIIDKEFESYRDHKMARVDLYVQSYEAEHIACINKKLDDHTAHQMAQAESELESYKANQMTLIDEQLREYKISQMAQAEDELGNYEVKKMARIDQRLREYEMQKMMDKCVEKSFQEFKAHIETHMTKMATGSN